MNTSKGELPEWDEDQLSVILEPRNSWMLVEAGPGAGKSAVACQRIAFLVDDGVPPSRILLISFTRTAVAELRDRITSYAAAGNSARGVRISTLDSYAWSLRVSVDDERISTGATDSSFDLNIDRAIEKLRADDATLTPFMKSLGHVIIDEAQDITNRRADLVLSILQSLSGECGVTVLADPVQAIYGFTSDSDRIPEEPSNLLERLPSESPRQLTTRRLQAIYRTKDVKLQDLYSRARAELTGSEAAATSAGRVQSVIRGASSTIEGGDLSDIAAAIQSLKSDSVLVLFRRRIDVLVASSYCSNAGIEHRIRMSDVPNVVFPWIGWLFHDETRSTVSSTEFDRIWDKRLSESKAPFSGFEPKNCWATLHKVAGGRASNTLDMDHLRGVLARSRPPIELCSPDLGVSGPILGTIHASKGREADTVLLFLPESSPTKSDRESQTDAAHREEGRVYYVGATRARKILLVANGNSRPAGYLESRRAYRMLGQSKVQLEVGRQKDTDPIAHFRWENALAVQQLLASLTGSSMRASATATVENKYRRRVSVEVPLGQITKVYEVGELSESFESDLKKLWSRVDRDQRLRPPTTIPHLRIAAVSTVGIGESDSDVVAYPFNKSRIGLMPIIRGFSLLTFVTRRFGGNR